MVKRTVYIRVVFLKVGEIDTVKEKYFADVFVQARWREPALDHSQHFENSNLKNYWGPKISVQNVIDSKKKKVLKELNFTPNGEAFITEKRKISGHISEKLELMDFPFDHQTLICVTSFATFAVSRKNTENRLGLSITLMLTAVTFRLTTNANLPNISYHTRLDKFILANMLFNWLVTAWHAVITRFDDDLQATIDIWAFLVFLIGYGLYLVVFVSLVLITYVFRNNELQSKLKIYEEKAEKLLGGHWKDSRSKEQVGVTIRRRAGLSYATPGTASAVYPMDT